MQILKKLKKILEIKVIVRSGTMNAKNELLLLDSDKFVKCVLIPVVKTPCTVYFMLEMSNPNIYNTAGIRSLSFVKKQNV